MVVDTTIECRRNPESGFTLVELLVVILVIGILVSIALPAFLGQRVKAQDSEAKTNARNMVSAMEGCWHYEESYIGCTAELDALSTGMPIGSGAGQVRIVSEDRLEYMIEATSEASTGGTSHTYRIEHTIGGTVARPCSPAGEGGCRPDGRW